MTKTTIETFAPHGIETAQEASRPIPEDAREGFGMAPTPHGALARGAGRAGPRPVAPIPHPTTDPALATRRRAA